MSVMQYLLSLPETELKIYYSDKVYSPKFSSLGTIMVTDLLIKDGKKVNATVLDVACGSGVIGLGVKKLHPFSDVTLCDVDIEAVRVTRLNAKRLGMGVGVFKCDLLPVLGNWDIITANLPTYDKEQMEGELHGPSLAYLGPGLDLYEKLFKQARGRCKALVCECQPKCQERFLKLAKSLGWVHVLSSGDSFGFQAKSS